MRPFALISTIAVFSFMATSALAQMTPLPKDPVPKDNGAAEKSEAKGDKPPAPDYLFTESPDDHVIGSEDAAQTLIVYASVTCSHCGTWFSEHWPKVKSELVETGKLRFVLRELPTPPAELSITGFGIAECAPDEDYFDVIQYQMENQAELFEQAKAGNGQAAYAKVAALAGLETDADIEACLGNPATVDHVYLSSNRANAAGVKGVPAFFINGQAYDGAQDADSLIGLLTEMDEMGVTELPETLPKPAKDADKEDHSGHNH
jgi:protein-disulfide isomerase